MGRAYAKNKGKATQSHTAVQRLSPKTNWEHQQSVNDWLRRNTAGKDMTAIFFTLKFHRKNDDGYGKACINEEFASRLVGKWLNKLDRSQATKRAIWRGQRLERVVFKQKGFSGENIHWHGILLTDADAERVLGSCKKFWAEETANGWVDAERSWMQIADHTYAAAKYAAHEVYKLGVEDSWSLEHTHMSNDGLRLAKQEQEKRRQRTVELREQRLKHEQTKMVSNRNN